MGAVPRTLGRTVRAGRHTVKGPLRNGGECRVASRSASAPGTRGKGVREEVNSDPVRIWDLGDGFTLIVGPNQSAIRLEVGYVNGNQASETERHQTEGPRPIDLAVACARRGALPSCPAALSITATNYGHEVRQF